MHSQVDSPTTGEDPRLEHHRGTRESPPIVLLPGLFAGGWIWQHAWDALVGRGYSVLRFSEPIASLTLAAGSVEKLCAHFKRALADAGVQQAFLCGNSMGGLLALALAADDPNAVVGVIASGAPGLGDQVDLGITPSQNLRVDVAHELAAKIFYAPDFVTESTIREIFDYLSQKQRLINMARALRAARLYEVEPMLNRVRCATQLIWGAQDAITPHAPWRECLQRFPAELTLIEACGHVPMLEQPAAFNAALLAFLEQRSAIYG